MDNWDNDNDNQQDRLNSFLPIVSVNTNESDSNDPFGGPLLDDVHQNQAQSGHSPVHQGVESTSIISGMELDDDAPLCSVGRTSEDDSLFGGMGLGVVGSSGIHCGTSDDSNGELIMDTSEPPSAAVDSEHMHSYEGEHSALMDDRLFEMDTNISLDNAFSEPKYNRIWQSENANTFVAEISSAVQEVVEKCAEKVSKSSEILQSMDESAFEKLGEHTSRSASSTPNGEAPAETAAESTSGETKCEQKTGEEELVAPAAVKQSQRHLSDDDDDDFDEPMAPFKSTIPTIDPEELARVLKEDERMLKLNNFKPITIPCERLEIVLQRDKKNLEREQLRLDRERRQQAAEQRRKERHRDDSSESRENRKERKKNRRDRDRSPAGSSDKPRTEAISPHKRTFNRLVQCCVCELIVQTARFGGKESAYCSADCIAKRVEIARKCVKEGERIMMMDTKGHLMNSVSTPTIENLEVFLNENPSYNPLIDDTKLKAASQRDLDPAQLKKMEAMRVDVRKAVETALQKRSKTANMNFSPKRYKELGHEVERALFAIHHDVNVKYRKWFKSFMTVINDEKNDYFKEVMRDRVSVKRLVTLNEDQMQIPVAVQPQQASTSASVLAAADSTSSLLDTGACDSIASISSKVLGGTQDRPLLAKKQCNAIGKSALDEILGEPEGDTSMLHASHFFNVNCKICKEEQTKKLAQKQRLKEQEEKLDEEMKQQHNKPYFPNLDPAIRAAMMDSDIDMPSSLSATMPPPSRHRKLPNFAPPQSDDPLGLNSVRAGDPLYDQLQEQQEDEENIDDFGGGFDDNYAEEDFGRNSAPPPIQTEQPLSPPAEDSLSAFGDEGADRFKQPSVGDFGSSPQLAAGNKDKQLPFRMQNRDPDGRHQHQRTGANTEPMGPSRFERFQSQVEEPKEDKGERTPKDTVSSAPPQNSDLVTSKKPIFWSTKLTANKPMQEAVQQDNAKAPKDTLADRDLDTAAIRSKHVAQQQAKERTPPPLADNRDVKTAAENWKRPPALLVQQEADMARAAAAEPDPWKRKSLQVWNGMFNFGRNAFFRCTLIACSHRAVFKAGREIGPTMHLIGHSGSQGVWQYIKEVKTQLFKQICMLVIERPQDERDFAEYLNFYERYAQGTQVGVLDFNGHETIKDGYVFVLCPNEQLPDLLLPLDGVGLPGWVHHHGAVVVVLIRRADHEDKMRYKRMQTDESWRRRLPADQTTPYDPLPIPQHAPTRDEMMAIQRAGNEPIRPTDPRLDTELTTRMGSRLYRFSRLYKHMPAIFDHFPVGTDEDEK